MWMSLISVFFRYDSNLASSDTNSFGCSFSDGFNRKDEWEIVVQGGLIEAYAFDGMDDHGATGLAPSFDLVGTLTLEVITFFSYYHCHHLHSG